jgi:agmatine deiminase
VFILVGLCLLGFALATRNTGSSPHRLPGVTTNVSSVSPRGSITTNVSSVSPRGSVTVSWSGVSSPAVKDWLGLYQSGAANSAYLKWKYDSSCTRTAGLTAKVSGSCLFTMPNTTGTYEFRLLVDDSDADIATSPTLTVTAAKG